MISIKNVYKPKNKNIMAFDVKKNIESNINILQYMLDKSNNYGCDIALRSNIGETEWMLITKDQHIKLIEIYKDRLENYDKKV